MIDELLIQLNLVTSFIGKPLCKWLCTCSTPPKKNLLLEKRKDFVDMNGSVNFIDFLTFNFNHIFYVTQLFFNFSTIRFVHFYKDPLELPLKVVTKSHSSFAPFHNLVLKDKETYNLFLIQT